MANELYLTAGFSFTKGNVASFGRALAALGVTVTGSRFIHEVQQVGTSEEALKLGELGSLGWCWVKNLDGTNFVSLRAATGGGNVIKLKAGECALFRFGSGVTAPFAIADTAACYIEYVIFED